VEVSGTDAAHVKDLVDAEVEVTGTASAMFEGSRQTGVILNVSSRDDIKVIRSVALTPLSVIHAFSHAEASRSLPVAFEATVTYSRWYEFMLFVEDEGVGIYVRVPPNTRLIPGDRVLVRGKTWDSFRPFIMGDSVTLLHHGTQPTAIPTNFTELIHMQRDCQLIAVRGVIRAADPSWGANGPTYLQILTSTGYVDAVLDNDDANARKKLLDADVEVTGVATAKLDGKLEETGIKLYVSSLANIKIIQQASASPETLPITPMDEIFTGYSARELTQRTRVHGTVTYYQPGSSVVLQNGSESMWVQTQGNVPLRVGDLADAAGFPTLHDGFLTLSNSVVQDSQVQAPIAPEQVTWQELSSSKHIFDLVSIEGQVVTEIREESQDEYVIDSGGNLFSALYRHPDAGSQIHLPSMKQIPLGSRVRVTGICMLKDSNPFNGQVPFEILLRSFDDVAVVAKPPWLNTRHLLIIVGLLLVFMALVGARGWTLERRVRRQTAAMAYVEQRRGHILEDINGSRPLAEIIEDITELASFKLHGAPCWCQIADGARLGKCPPEPTALRVAHNEIPARLGPPLGVIFAAFDTAAKPVNIESEALSMAVGLIELAIETRRLYTDLLHRSEFDLLTDIHNRFSLEKRLDTQIEIARQNAGIFGLIYVDLDEFKQVNDIYGHHVGDLYLQEAARRMKLQLRSHDLLARLGGDEFAVLLPMVRNRADVEEIAQRLEHCFDTPLVLEGHALQGSASFGIALYPEDSATTDGILSSADAAMYVMKKGKKLNREAAAGQEAQHLTAAEHT
jgi:diguanylate cyclase (GGDEF)-like protein